jgi:hypothetical protein
MKKRDYLVLFISEIFIILVIGAFQKAPGYMDAEYYFSGGQRLVEGYGFSEEFLWNYLDDPQGLPHPSHGYWMPLASIFAAIGMAVVQNISFSAGRIVFILLAGAIPPLSAFLSYHINQRRDFAILSGIIAVLPGFYLSYLGTTDTFGLLMIFGGLFFLLISIKTPEINIWQQSLIYGGLGLIAGLMHLSRVDGALWLLIIFIYIFIEGFEKRKDQVFGQLFISGIIHLCISLVGYFLIMGPWMVRNYAEFGILLSPGGTKSMWITNYNELYSYPASILNMTHWINSGISEIIKARVSAGWTNIQSAIVVEGEIFLAPLMIWGLWRNRARIQVKLAVIAWLGVFTVMTIVFPYQGARGGFFHSASPFQPLLWAMAPVGLDAFISWGKRVRHWNYSQAKKVFQIGIIGLACFIGIVLVSKRVIGGNFAQPEWNQSYNSYVQLESKINQLGIKPGEIVMVNNPPGYYLASNRPCIVIPDGGVEQVLQVAHRYHAKYLVLEANHPAGLENLYKRPEEQPGLEYLYSYDGAYVFYVDNSN